MRHMQYAGQERVDNLGHLLWRAARMGRHLRWPALGALFTTVLATVARLLGPVAVRGGVDEGIAAGNKGAVTVAALVFLALIGIQYLAQRTAQYAVAWLGERYLRMLRVQLFRHLIRLDMPFFDRSKAGVLVSRMTSDIDSITEFVDEGAVTLLTNLLTVFGVALAMVLVDWRLAAWVFVLIALLAMASLVFQRFAGRAYREVREQVGRVLSGLQEGISGVRVVQAFTQEEEQAGQFGSINERYFDANMRAAKAIAWYFPLVAFLRVAGIGIVLFVGGHRVVRGEMTVGSLIAFLFYLDWFFQPIINLSNIYNQMQAAAAGLGKVFSLLDTDPTVTERSDAGALPQPVVGDVAVQDVTFGYNPAIPVLLDVDIAIAPGERVAIVGETGAGKSTVAKLVMRFYDPVTGTVTIDGTDLRDLTTAARAATIGLIPQDGFLFDGSLRDNLRYARPDASDEEIWEACRAMGIEEWVRSLPERLDTEVRERGTRFSAGERQLVALARALMSDPAVIVLDEATSNLDPETEAAVERALAAVLAGRTAIVIAHRLRSAERADRVVMIDAGRVVAEGTHEQLVAAGGDYARLVEVWQRGGGM